MSPNKSETTHDDATTKLLIDRLRTTFPAWKVCAHAIQYPPQGDCATVAFFRDHVIKMVPVPTAAKPLDPAFVNEIWLLRTLTRALADVRQNGADFFGVNVPVLLDHPDLTRDLSFYVMDRLPGQSRDRTNLSAGHPDVIDQIATFFVRFDDVVQTAWTAIKDAPRDPLEEAVVRRARSFEYQQDQRAQDGFFWEIDHEKLAQGEKIIQETAPDFLPYLDRAKELMRALTSEPQPRAFMHGDLHIHNVLLDIDRDPQTQAVRSVQTGIIDFGILHWGDPRFGLAKLFLCSDQHEQTRAIVEAINAKRAAQGRAPWGDPRTCAKLAPLHLTIQAAHNLPTSHKPQETRQKRRHETIRSLKTYLDQLDRKPTSHRPQHDILRLKT